MCVPWARDGCKAAAAQKTTASEERRNAKRRRLIVGAMTNMLWLSLLKLGPLGQVTFGDVLSSQELKSMRIRFAKSYIDLQGTCQ
jgi:hypothetical protein